MSSPENPVPLNRPGACGGPDGVSSRTHHCSATDSDRRRSRSHLGWSACAVTTRSASTPLAASRVAKASSSSAPPLSQRLGESTVKSSTKPSAGRRWQMAKPCSVRSAIVWSEPICRRRNRVCRPVASAAGRQKTGE